ncbi:MULTISPECIES: hypothetical protein [unclassified Brevundimonas]|uniref:hypothetical protein n=1 Tax=unclassified Brevundimonas TaxID=2622653 RepID=UPI003F900A76
MAALFGVIPPRARIWSGWSGVGPEANKGAVFLTLAKRVDITPEQVAQRRHDIQKSGFSIAMGNASDAVKANDRHDRQQRRRRVRQGGTVRPGRQSQIVV